MADGESKATHDGEIDGTPRHLLEFDGERLLDRTVRLFPDVWIVGPYDIPGATRYEPVRTPANRDLDMAYKTMPVWNPDGLTILLYGDVLFTDDAAERIIAADDDWHVFGREGRSEWTGTGWGEQFAVTFWPQHHGLLRQAMDDIIALYADEGIRQCTVWQWYRLLEGQPLRRHRVGAHWIEIDDYTDDIDFVDDYRRMTTAWGLRA